MGVSAKNTLHPEEFRHLIAVAAGREDPDLVLKHARYVNVFSQRLCEGDIALAGGCIAGIGDYSGPVEEDFTSLGVVLPGLIDAHIHLESALVLPAEFGRTVLPHGTTTIVTDPHEMANVMGCDGISYMLAATEGLGLDVRFVLPSCVPASPQDESGARLDADAIDHFYSHPRVLGLAEVMDFPGVVAGEAHVLQKLLAARARGAVIDGHAPALTGHALDAYIAAGILSDHECSTMEEALAKLELGQFVMLREGTAAHNLKALVGLLAPPYADRCMLCCDDRHPGDLLCDGHMDHLLRLAVAMGADPLLAVRAATLNTARYFGLTDRGAVAPGLRADLVVVDDLVGFHVSRVYAAGRPYPGADAPHTHPAPPAPNTSTTDVRERVVLTESPHTHPICPAPEAPKASEAPGYDTEPASVTPPCPDIDPALEARARDTFHLPTIEPRHLCVTRPLGVLGLVPGELTTRDLGVADHMDAGDDLLKLVVAERHRGTGHVGLGFLRGYGLKAGAVATSVAHDSHNIIAVGTDDDDLAFAINHIAELRGGIAVVLGGRVVAELPLPIAGLLSDRALPEVSACLERCKDAARSLGVSPGIDPFMTLGFLSLPVIPALRLTTRGVFDVARQAYL
ncbi:MAG: adenine deaminase [Lachnospiraceae bacterium]|jgi:adenine deaminase|nr:adenine deaminase [Lachnospiraceae bacterium]